MGRTSPPLAVRLKVRFGLARNGFRTSAIRRPGTLAGQIGRSSFVADLTEAASDPARSLRLKRCRDANTLFRGGDLTTPRHHHPPARTFSATVVSDSRRRPAAFDKITEVPHVAQSRRLAAALSAHA